MTPKRQEVLRLLTEDPSRSNREIAGIVGGISHVAVFKIRKSLKAGNPVTTSSVTSDPVTTPKVTTKQVTTKPVTNGVTTPLVTVVTDLDSVPVADLADKINAWPVERRAALMRLLKPAVPGRRDSWKYKAPVEKEDELIALVNGGMTVKQAAAQLEYNYSTARSAIQRARKMGRLNGSSST